MKKIQLTAMLYSKKNLDLGYKLHRWCKDYSVNLVTALDFVDLTIKSMQLVPDIVFCDCSTIELSGSNINALMQKREFKNTKMFFIGNSEKTNKLSKILIGENMHFVEMNEIPMHLDKIQSNIYMQSYSEISNAAEENEINEKITIFLGSIGFVAKHTGYAYLREIIKNVVINDGIVHSLSSDQYPFIAAKFKTSTSNVERNIRNSIDYAWNYYGKQNWFKIFSAKNMELGEKPTNREFIYLCSDKILSNLNSKTLITA